MNDVFEDHAQSLTSPVTAAETISPSDTTDLTQATRALYVGVGGELAVQMLSGDVVTLNNVQAGVLYPLRARRVMATGTTAAGLIGFY